MLEPNPEIVAKMGRIRQVITKRTLKKGASTHTWTSI